MRSSGSMPSFDPGVVAQVRDEDVGRLDQPVELLAALGLA